MTPAEETRLNGLMRKEDAQNLDRGEIRVLIQLSAKRARELESKAVPLSSAGTHPTNTHELRSSGGSGR
jgi:hypothetical protein